MTNVEIEFYESGKDILLIVTGAGGTTKGFQNKYETIAKLIMHDYHFSVMVATSPIGSWLTMKENMQYIMDSLFAKKKEENFRVYVMGSSIGANIVLSYSYLFPQIKKVLAINPVLNMNLHRIHQGIKSFTGEKISVVFGEKDLSSKYIVTMPTADVLQTIVLPNIDHTFKDNLQTFIDLPNQFLFDNNNANE